MGMSAIAEPAKRGQLRDFREQGSDAMGRIADMERAYSRRINHPATARNGVNRARGRSVASFRVAFANLPGLLRQRLHRPRQNIDYCRFANARRADQRHCLPHPTPRGQCSRGVTGMRGQRHDGQAALQGCGLLLIGLRIIRGVDLGQFMT